MKTLSCILAAAMMAGCAARATPTHGALSKQQIRQVVRTGFPSILRCYDQQRRVRPELGGTVAVRIVIAPSGVVRSAGVHTSSLHDRAVEQCTVDVIRALRFPEPENGAVVVVDYPIRLSP